MLMPAVTKHPDYFPGQICPRWSSTRHPIITAQSISSRIVFSYRICLRWKEWQNHPYSPHIYYHPEETNKRTDWAILYMSQPFCAPVFILISPFESTLGLQTPVACAQPDPHLRPNNSPHINLGKFFKGPYLSGLWGDSESVSNFRTPLLRTYP